MEFVKSSSDGLVNFENMQFNFGLDLNLGLSYLIATVVLQFNFGLDLNLGLSYLIATVILQRKLEDAG